MNTDSNIDSDINSDLASQPSAVLETEGPFSIAPPPAATPVHSIFMGQYGLRAGWSLLIYLAMIVLIGMAVNRVHRHIVKVEKDQKIAAAHAAGKPAPVDVKAAPDAPMPVLPMMTQEGITFGILLLVTVVMALIERRRFSAYGLGGAHALSRFMVGTFWGLAAMALLIGTMRLLNLVSFDAQLDHGATQILREGSLGLALFLGVGLLEEYLFRGYLQYTLIRGLVGLGTRLSPNHGRAVAFWLATVITSVLFFLAHTSNDGEDKIGLVLVFLAGVTFVIALWRTGSLWWAIGFHMAWDWSQSFLYGVPDSGLLMQGRMFATHPMGNPMLSGGTVGPEGSLLCIPILLLTIVVLLFTRPAPMPPLETTAQLAAVATPDVVAA